jgi:hypothetical protein
MVVLINKSKSNEYYTPKVAWTDIEHLLDKTKIYHEPFNNIHQPLSQQSRKDLANLGFFLLDTPPFNPDTNENSFLDDKSTYDILIGNPPFIIKKKIMDYLYKIDKPFILIMPSQSLTFNYMKKFKEHLQIVVPKKRFHFHYYLDVKSPAYFDTYYFCYKINLPQNMIFL